MPIARSMRLPAVEPMACTLVADPFDHPDWIFEPKYDGLRLLGRFDGKNLELLSRNHKSQNLQFPEILAALRKSLTGPAIVDGEVVCFDDKGRTSFRALQQRFHITDPAEVETRKRKHPATIYLFDILYLGRLDVRAQPLEQRKKLLRRAVKWSSKVRWTEYEFEYGRALLYHACRAGNEGIIGKHLHSAYVGGRSDRWVKIKCVNKQEFVIGGFTEPQRSRVGLGALLVGYYSADNKKLLYAGKVGTGYTNDMLLDLRKRLDKLKTPFSPFDEGGPGWGSPVHWVRPKLVAEIAFAEWTQNDLLRQPRFEGLRPDKQPQDCHRERPKSPSRKASHASLVGKR